MGKKEYTKPQVLVFDCSHLVFYAKFYKEHEDFFRQADKDTRYSNIYNNYTKL